MDVGSVPARLRRMLSRRYGFGQDHSSACASRDTPCTSEGNRCRCRSNAGHLSNIADEQLGPRGQTFRARLRRPHLPWSKPQSRSGIERRDHRDQLRRRTQRRRTAWFDRVGPGRRRRSATCQEPQVTHCQGYSPDLAWCPYRAHRNTGGEQPQ